MTRLIRTCDSRTVLLSLAGQCCEDVCWTGLDLCVGTSASRINSPHQAAVRCVFLSGSPAQRLLGQRPQHKQCDRINLNNAASKKTVPQKSQNASFILTDPEGNTETMEAFKRVTSFCVSTHVHSSHSCHQSPHYINVPGLQSCHSLLFWQLMEQMFLLIKVYFGGFNLQESLSQYVGSRRTRMNIT